MKTFSWKRLKQLDFSFHFHRLLNEAQEIESTQMDDPKDFSNGRPACVAHVACGSDSDF